MCILSSANLVIAKFLSQRLQELIHFPTALLVAEHNLGDKAARAVYYRDRRLNFTTFATSVKAVASQPHSGLLTFRASSTSSNFRDAAFFAPLPENLHLLD